VIGYYDAQKTPRGAYLIIAGDIDEETAVREAQLTFGHWTARIPASTRSAAARPDGEGHLPGGSSRKHQADVIVGHWASR